MLIAQLAGGHVNNPPKPPVASLVSIIRRCSCCPTNIARNMQVIVTVALVPPKRGVFQESVKHVLAVATTVEVVLLAVTYQGESKEASGRNRRIQVIFHCFPICKEESSKKKKDE